MANRLARVEHDKALREQADGEGQSTGGRSVLRITGLSKRFGGVYAVDDVSLECFSNEIVGLIGPNGAGKTTLLNLVAGTLAPEGGEVRVGEVHLTGMPPRACARRGLSRTFQNIRLFGRLTVRQNLEVSAAVCRRHRRHADALSVGELLKIFELTDVADNKAATLPYGLQRRTEVARALALGPSFMLLDEPAAGMNEGESTRLAKEILDIRDRTGCGVVVIDHDLRFIMGLCERIYVLHEGRILCHGQPHEVQGDARVQEVYLGTRRTRRAEQGPTAAPKQLG